MKRIITAILVGLTISAAGSPVFAQTPPPEAVATASPTMAPTTQQVDSFELFWPIAAGKVRGETLYFLKSLKEKIRELLIFSNYKKGDYNITLSVKRTVEAEKLFVDKKDLENAGATLQEAQTKRDKAYELIQKARDEEGKEVKDLVYTLKNSLEKQKLLLESLIPKVEDEAKKVIEENLNSLDSLHSKLG